MFLRNFNLFREKVKKTGKHLPSFYVTKLSRKTLKRNATLNATHFDVLEKKHIQTIFRFVVK